MKQAKVTVILGPSQWFKSSVVLYRIHVKSLIELIVSTVF